MFMGWRGVAHTLKWLFIDVLIDPDPHTQRTKTIRKICYHDGRHDHGPVLHCRAVIGQRVLILDQHQLVNVIPVANLEERERDEQMQVKGIQKNKWDESERNVQLGNNIAL
jgi:hypothetical protein